jgi:DNA-binding GntR family transcriptional regulator
MIDPHIKFAPTETKRESTRVKHHPFLIKAKAVSIATQVADTLRQAILSGQFKPGERLVERRLADSIAVSLASVRDALQQLDREGIVTRLPNTGTFVTELSSKRLADMIDVRLLLEPTAMIAASRNMTEDHAAELRHLADEIERVAINNEFYQLFVTDFAFHQRVWQISGNETLEKLLKQLCTPVFAFLMIINSVKRHELANRVISHQVVVDALRSGDESQIEACVRAHILTSKLAITDLP